MYVCMNIYIDVCVCAYNIHLLIFTILLLAAKVEANNDIVRGISIDVLLNHFHFMVFRKVSAKRRRR